MQGPGELALHGQLDAEGLVVNGVLADPVLTLARTPRNFHRVRSRASDLDVAVANRLVDRVSLNPPPGFVAGLS